MKKKDIRILLVDDEPDVIEIIKYNLEQEGYNVKTASNGKEALKKAQKKTPHLIIMDVMMQKKIGWQGQRWEKADTKVYFGSIPLVSICVQGGPGTSMFVA